MSLVETRVSLWEALAGRAPGKPVGPADPGLWSAVADRVNPAKARPILRPGVEEAALVSARGVGYTMLRSPDGPQACYLRLAPEEVDLIHLMDGSRTLARLVAEFARISGRLAPDQVRRIVADLAGNRMLEELPVDAFRPLRRVHRRPWPIRFGRGLLAFVQGRRVVLANIDPAVGLLYRAGGRLLFTRAAAALMGTVAVLGVLAFGWQWWTGEQSVFLTGNSYFAGAALLLGLNVLALACHELGHALATKHAGRRVPAAGFLVYFGIPSVFVDTTDVWMAGRRGRLLTTAAGPAAGLVLAGASALVAFAVPAAAPWCFKLSFAWYINALFNLNPFLALDGYYLVMDWLEVPNLRARGLAWVIARLRRRPPAWRALDREGRLIALYGMLAIGWLAIALNIGYRVYVDRVGGLVTGLWRSGWWARVLLVVVVAALMSPIVYIGAAWLGRRWRRLRQRASERRVGRDAPRRLDALRTSSLRELPVAALSELAQRARWVYPGTGEQLVFAGAAQPEVYAVVEGALEGRAPDDPVGTVRERVGAGGVVGLAAAVTGAPSPLAWYTAGTRLLAMPSTAVAAAVGPVTGGSLGDASDPTGTSSGTAAEARGLFAESPAMASLSTEDTLGLATVAVPVSLGAGAPVVLSGAADALVIISGIIALPDGEQLGRGTMIGPSGVDGAQQIAVARSPVRLYRVPAASGLPLLLGGSAGGDAEPPPPGRAPVYGVHPPAGYPPLASPPGPPPPVDADDQDDRFERRMRWFVILVILVALLFTGTNLVLGKLAWAEMPTDRVLLHAERGPTAATVDGAAVELDEGQDRYLGEGDSVRVPPRSRATLTFRGGAVSILCAGAMVDIGPLASAGHPVSPYATLSLRAGLTLTDTAGTSPAFTPLAAAWRLPDGTAANDGPAWFATASWGVVVAEGVVTYNGIAVEPTHASLGCGDGEVSRPSTTPTATPTPTETPTPTPTATPTPTPTPTVAVPTTTTKTTTKPPTTTTTTTTQPPPPPPAKISNVRIRLKVISQLRNRVPCGNYPPTTDILVDITGEVSASGSYKIGSEKPVAMGFQVNGDTYTFRLGPIDWTPQHAGGGDIVVTISALNSAHVRTSVTFTITLDSCIIVPG